MTTLLRAGTLACALLTSTALTTPALAQTGQSVPPAHRAIDDNGVDLVSGSFPFTLIEGRIGSGEGELSLTRTGTSAYGASNLQNIWLDQSNAGSTVDIILGDQSERFTSVGGGVFVAAQANGATLTGGGAGANYVYSDPNGVQITFGAPVDDQFGTSPFCAHINADQNSCRGLALSVVRPNGAHVDFAWDIHAVCSTIFNPDGSLDCNYAWRLGGISNSFGYEISLSYVSNSVPFQQMPSGDWFKRSGATLSNANVSGASQSISYTYVSSTVTDITDGSGQTWRFTTGTNSLGIRRPGSGSDDISVTYSGGAVSQVVRDGVTTNYSRSVNGNTATTTITDALNNQTVVVADISKSRITSVTDPLNRMTSYQYDSNGRMTRITDPEGNYQSFTYDGRGNLTEARAVPKSGSGLSDIVTTASFPSSCTNIVTCNLPTSTTDARGNTTDYSWDSTHGGLLSVTAPAATVGGTRPQTRYSYSQVTAVTGQPVYLLTGISACQTTSSCSGGADETKSTISYNTTNLLPTSVSSGNGNGTLNATTTSTYDGFGNLLTIDGPLSGSVDTVRYRYNGARQLIGVIGPDPDAGGSLKHRAIRTTYRSDGLPTKVEQGTVNSQSDSDWASMSVLEELQVDYDFSDRPTVQRAVSGATTYALMQTSYDAVGRVQCVAERMNPSEFNSLPADACTLDTTGSFGHDRIAKATYDQAGQLTRVQTGFGVTGVEADEITTTYASNGQVSTVTDAEGNRTTYEYDGHDRLVKTRYPDPSTDNTSSATDYEQFSLDANGNVTNLRLRDNQNIAFTHDALNRVITKDLPGSEPTVTYTYDLLHRMTGASVSGHALSFTFDALGRNLTQAGPHGTVSYVYDLAGRRTQMTYADSGLYVDYDYNDAGDLTKIRENGATSGVGVLGTYAYDDRGRRTSLTRGNGRTTSYSYDNVDRMTQLVHDLNGTSHDLTLDFTFNPANQIISNTRSNDTYAYTGHANINRIDTVNGLNQITATGGTSVSRDSRGNITAIGASSYAYNSENMLTSAPGGVSLSYDPALRLYQVSNGSTTTRFAYDGDHLIAEYNGSNALQRRYVFGPGVDEPLLWYEGTGIGTRRWFHADERSSVVAVSDSSGNVVSTVNRYDEFGAPQGTLTGRFGFTGQAWIPEAGLSNYRARNYNPGLGRFMQADPVGYASGMNLYAYVINDPVNLIDPDGLQYRGGVGTAQGTASVGVGGSVGRTGNFGGGRGGGYGGGGSSAGWVVSSRPSSPSSTGRTRPPTAVPPVPVGPAPSRRTPDVAVVGSDKPSAPSNTPVYANTKERLFSVAETKILTQLFGKGTDDALSLIKKMQEPDFTPPKGTTIELIEKYLAFIEKVGETDKPMHVQDARADAAIILLKFLKSKTKDENPKDDPKGK